MQTTDFTHTQDGVTVTLSVPTSSFQQACASSQWPYMRAADNQPKQTEVNQKLLGDIYTEIAQSLSEILAELFLNPQYIAIGNITLQSLFLPAFREKWQQDFLPILKDKDIPLSPALQDVMFRLMLKIGLSENETAKELLQTDNSTLLTGHTIDFTHAHNGITVSISIPTSSFQQACASSQWPYMQVEENQKLLGDVYTEIAQSLSEILAELFLNLHYMAGGNDALQHFLKQLNTRWSEDFLPFLKDSTAGEPLAPVLTDFVCSYMVYELKKYKGGVVERQFQEQNSTAFEVLCSRAFGHPVFEYEPPIVVTNRSNQQSSKNAYQAQRTNGHSEDTLASVPGQKEQKSWWSSWWPF